jgi:hypothetical protein
MVMDDTSENSIDNSTNNENTNTNNDNNNTNTDSNNTNPYDNSTTNIGDNYPNTSNNDANNDYIENTATMVDTYNNTSDNTFNNNTNNSNAEYDAGNLNNNNNDNNDNSNDNNNYNNENNNNNNANTWTTQPDFTHTPTLLAVADEYDDVRVVGSNFVKGVKWAPDGTCFLTSSEDNRLRLFELPKNIHDNNSNNNNDDGNNTSNNVEHLKSVLSVREAETIYSYCWYPMMTSLDPSTCCFLTSSRDHPVHMWDAFTGQQRGVYRGYDTKDEIRSPYSVSFDVTGERILCGYDGQIYYFYTNRPGRDDTLLYNWEKKVHGKSGGIMSCFATTPCCPNLIACGSYAKTCNMIDLSVSKKEKRLVGSFSDPVGRMAGVTHVLYSRDGWRVYAGARKSNEILCWDLRTMSDQPLHRYLRAPTVDYKDTTNQRIEFDFHPSGRYLITGSQSGQIYVYDTNNPDSHLSPSPFSTHKDTVNGVSVHPTLPLVAFSTGQRKFEIGGDTYDDVSSDDELSPSAKRQKVATNNGIFSKDNLVSVWKYNALSVQLQS